MAPLNVMAGTWKSAQWRLGAEGSWEHLAHSYLRDLSIRGQGQDTDFKFSLKPAEQRSQWFWMNRNDERLCPQIATQEVVVCLGSHNHGDSNDYR